MTNAGHVNKTNFSVTVSVSDKQEIKGNKNRLLVRVSERKRKEVTARE